MPTVFSFKGRGGFFFLSITSKKTGKKAGVMQITVA